MPQRPAYGEPNDDDDDDYRAGGGDGDVWVQRAEAVRGAFLEAYNGYVEHAAGHDELLPLSKAPTDKYVLLFCIVLRASFLNRITGVQLQRMGLVVYRVPRHVVDHGPLRGV
jgi:hypothetical protein